MPEPVDIATSPRMRFSAAFDELELAYDRKLALGRREVYWKYLRRVPIDDLCAAVALCITSYTTFPKVPQWAKLAERVRKSRAAGIQKTGDGIPIRGELPRPDHGGYFCELCRDTGWFEVKQWIKENAREYTAVRKCCREGNNPRVAVLFDLKPAGAPASAPYFQDEGEKEAASRREEREPTMFE
jgi:hypothetical protein